MNFIKHLFSAKDNIADVALGYARILGIPVSRTSLLQAIAEHPDYPSMLAVHDVLAGFGAETLAARVGIGQLGEIGQPFIVQMRYADAREEIFSIVKTVEVDTITYWHHEQQKWISTSKDEFGKLFTGVVLVASATDVKPEADYAQKRYEERRRATRTWLSLLFFPTLLLFSIGIALSQDGSNALWMGLFGLLALAGTVIGLLLLWHEVDQHNPVLKQVCSGGKSVNCNAILQSSASSIFGISWSVIGFTYFAGQLIALLMGGLPNSGIYTLLGYLSLAASLYIPFSIYYQWRIARQWCVLCLATQAVFALQAGLFIAFGTEAMSFSRIQPQDILLLLVAFGIPFISAYWGVPLLKQVKEGKQHFRKLQRLKHNPQIFDALLARQKTITENPEGLGISLGNPTAKNQIIKVCNPYCGPCAQAHPAIEEILHANPDVSAQIIFTAEDDGTDRKAPPVRHLLAIASQGNEEKTKQALDDWYNAPVKDYDTFAAKYPMNGELQTQGDKLAAMRGWCHKTEISFTPTFFVNGHQLPEIYTVDDLKYFLKK